MTFYTLLLLALLDEFGGFGDFGDVEAEAEQRSGNDDANGHEAAGT